MQKLLLLLAICFTFTANISAQSKHIKLSNTDSDKKANNAVTTETLLKAYLDRSAFKQKILSENMAHVNTPNYKANDVADVRDVNELVNGSSKVNRLKLLRTNSKHIISKNSSASKFESHKLKDSYEVKPNGNNVSIAQQMQKISKNQQDYSLALKAYSSAFGLAAAAIGK